MVPSSLSVWTQCFGHAGRSGNPAVAILLVKPSAFQVKKAKHDKDDCNIKSENVDDAIDLDLNNNNLAGDPDVADVQYRKNIESGMREWVETLTCCCEVSNRYFNNPPRLTCGPNADWRSYWHFYSTHCPMLWSLLIEEEGFTRCNSHGSRRGSPYSLEPYPVSDQASSRTGSNRCRCSRPWHSTTSLTSNIQKARLMLQRSAQALSWCSRIMALQLLGQTLPGLHLGTDYTPAWHCAHQTSNMCSPYITWDGCTGDSWMALCKSTCCWHSCCFTEGRWFLEGKIRSTNAGEQGAMQERQHH